MRSMLRILSRSPKFIIGFAIFSLIMLVIFCYPLINKADPLEMVATGFAPPDLQHILGFDNFGRDVLLELVHATKTSIFIGLLAGLIATGIGLTLGLLAGFIGGTTDNIIAAVINIFLVIPSFIILILITASLNTRSAVLIALIIGATSWPWVARAVRAQATSLRVRDHVNIARISGYSTLKIIIFEILPYIASYVTMAFILTTSSGILQEATISMLGLGPLNTVSLGIMMNWAIMFEAPAAHAWWALLPPAFTIAAIVFSLQLTNTGMDEIFNPKIRS